MLRYLEERPPREIARRLGVPVATVKTRLKRVLAMLRGRLDVDHDGDRGAWVLLLLPLAGRRATASGGMLAAATVAVGVVLLLVAGVVHSAGSAPAPARPGFGAGGGAVISEAGARSSGAAASAVSESATASAAPSDRRKGGRVVDGEGRPVPGAILVGPGWMSRPGNDHRIPEEWDRADEDGRFRVSPRWVGRDLFAAVPGESVSAWTRIEPGTEGLDLVVGPGAAVRGRVRDVLTGEPIPSARVELVVGESANPPLFITHCGPDGEYRFDGVPTGVMVHPRLASSAFAMTEGTEEFLDLQYPTVLADLRRDGRARSFERPGEVWNHDLEAHAIPGTLVTFELIPGPLPLPDELDLKLVTNVRLPLAEEFVGSSGYHRISGHEDRAIDIRGRRKTFTHTQVVVWHVAADRPELTLRLPRGETRFRVRGQGVHGEPPPVQITGEEEPFRIEVRLERELRVVARLVDETGRPIRRAGIRVCLWQASEAHAHGTKRSTDEEGSADFTDVAPLPEASLVDCERFLLTVEGEGVFHTTNDFPSRVVPREEYLRLGAAAKSGVLVLDVPVRELGELTFLVVDSDGKPQPNVAVRLVDDEFHRGVGQGEAFVDDRVVSDEEGRIGVRVRSVDFGFRDTLVAQLPWRGQLALYHLDGDDRWPYPFQVEHVSPAEITILDDEGHPLSNRDVDIAGQRVRTDSAGVVRLDLRSDRTGASVTTEGWLEGDVKLDPETRAGTVRLERGRVIEIEYVCESPVEVEYYDATDGRRLRGAGSTGGASRATFPRVPIRITAAERRGEGSADVLVPLGQDRVRVVLQKRPPVRARIVLVDPRGLPMREVPYVLHVDPWERRLEGMTDADGGIDVEIPPGTYTAFPSGRGLLELDRPPTVRLEAGAEAPICVARVVPRRIFLPAGVGESASVSVSRAGEERWIGLYPRPADGEAGAFLLPLPVGPFTLRVEAGDREVGRTSWDGDPPERIDFR